jgi:integrase
MGVKPVNSSRSSKGSVSISPYKNGLRLRWRHNGQRPEIYVPPSVPNFQTTASKIKTCIEQDFSSGNYDETLRRYRAFLEFERAALQEEVEQPKQSPLFPMGKNREEVHRLNSGEPINVLKEFGRYLAAKSMSIDSEELSSYYTQTIAMLKNWGDFDIEDTPVKLGVEKFGPKTFNDRRNCLFKFFAWLVKKGKIKENPLEEVATKRRLRHCEQRKPFTESEIAAILEALRTDRFKHPSARYSHSQYVLFVTFMLYTGVRNAEAVGLKIKDIIFPKGDDLRTGSIRIGRTLARTCKGTHIGARKEKGTKMNNVRLLPFNMPLLDLLLPICSGRDPEEYVFLNENGNPIDDRQFLKRIFKPVQEKLGIEKRDLYACRHTFATRAVQQGVKPHEVAYVMGDRVETVLENYFHNNRRPEQLPSFSFDVPIRGSIEAVTESKAS